MKLYIIVCDVKGEVTVLRQWQVNYIYSYLTLWELRYITVAKDSV